MLNSGKKFRALHDKKKVNILTLVLSEKKILNETKNHKLNDRSLMYADDTVLFSENVHELQNMINVVNVCSNEYNLHVNLKTKVVIFRNRGNIKSEEKWYLNGESIEIYNEFMYLGILLNYNGVFTNTQKMLSNQGKKAVFSLFSKIQDDYFNTETLLSLFDTYVKSIVNYGCEVWGFHKGVDIETLHLSFLKRVLKVRKSTSNYMVYFELGRFPLYINRYCRMLNYWFKILKTENCILKNCYEDMFESNAFKPNDKLNWGCKIRDILCKYGFNHVWLSQNVVNEYIFMLEFKQRVIDTFLNEAISFFEESPKCHFYKYIYDDHNLQFYLSRPVNYMFKPLISRYRLHAHSLNIETGRYYNIDRHARICNMCNNNDIEDEYHFILECSKYVEIRRKYIKPYYCINPSAFKLTPLLSVQNIKELNNLGKYLYVAEKFVIPKFISCSAMIIII